MPRARNTNSQGVAEGVVDQSHIYLSCVEALLVPCLHEESESESACSLCLPADALLPVIKHQVQCMAVGSGVFILQCIKNWPASYNH